MIVAFEVPDCSAPTSVRDEILRPGGRYQSTGVSWRSGGHAGAASSSRPESVWKTTVPGEVGHELVRWMEGHGAEPSEFLRCP